MIDTAQPSAKLDAVLTAFQAAHPKPSARDIADWCARYPKLADEIREHAGALLLSTFGPAGQSDPARYEASLRRAIERARQRIGDDPAPRVPRSTGERSFADLIGTRHLDVPSLARRLDVARVVIGEYVSGRMTLPPRRRFVAALADILSVTAETLAAAVEASRADAAAGQAKVGGESAQPTRTYDEVVEQSPMSDERKAYWLERD